MSSTYYLPTRLQLCAYACLAFGGLLIAAPGDDAKIENTLLAQLASDEEATANFFVVFGDQPDLSQAENIKDKAARGKFVGLALKNTAERSQSGVRGYLQGKKVAFTAFWIENKIFVPNGTLDLARDLSKRKEVVAIIPEVIYSIPQPQGSASSLSGTPAWGVAKIHADQVWGTTTGSGIVVANVDTGVQFDHPALVNQYRGNNGGVFTHTGNWFDPTGTSPSFPADNVGHGSHTMGTMVGSDGTNLIGVAPGAKWIACKGCASNSCSGSNLISCAQWMIDPLRDNSMANQPDVVNNSWGGGSGDTWYQSYINNWRIAGIFPAFSAGNSGSACGTANSPGDNTTAFASGATDSNDAIAYFSSRGPSLFGGIKPDVSAPGVSVYSSVPTSSYAYYSGTSMASPHTAGTVALLWAAAPQWRGNISGTEQLLRSTATKLTSLENCGGTANVTPNDTFGFGRIDAVSLINGAGTPVNHPPTISISAPHSGDQFNCSSTVPVSFSGTATDQEDGATAITSHIVWNEGTFQFGTTGSASEIFTCSQNPSELHTISASVTDTGGASASTSVTITIVNPSVPAAPTGLTATVSNKIVTLTWNWNSTGQLTGFRLERKSNGKGAWTPVFQTDIDPSLRTITNSPGAGNWQYRIFAKNGGLTSASSNIVSVKIR